MCVVVFIDRQLCALWCLRAFLCCGFPLFPQTTTSTMNIKRKSSVMLTQEHLKCCAFLQDEFLFVDHKPTPSILSHELNITNKIAKWLRSMGQARERDQNQHKHSLIHSEKKTKMTTENMYKCNRFVYCAKYDL